MILPAPMLVDNRRPAPFAPGWIYELKYDGHRLIAGVQDGQVQLATRNGVDASKWFPEIVQGLARVPGGPHILDGEVVVLDEDLGRSDFNRLQERWRHRRWYEGCDQVTYTVFDCLACNGHSIIGSPVEERKEHLRELLTPAPPAVLFLGHFGAEHGRWLFERAVQDLKLEGIVAKRMGSPYRPGERSPDWRRAKRPGWQEGRVWRA